MVSTNEGRAVRGKMERTVAEEQGTVKALALAVLVPQ